MKRSWGFRAENNCYFSVAFKEKTEIVNVKEINMFSIYLYYFMISLLRKFA